MVIRRREKPLTPEEAIEQAKKQLAPYWFGCPEPLMTAVKGEAGVQAYPLDARMTERAWMIFFLDPYSLAARDALLYAQSWAHRYEPQKLNVMVILRLPYPFTNESLWGHKFSQQLEGPVVTVMDRDALLHQAFHVKELPRVLLLHQNKQIVDRSGAEWYRGTELEIQKFLRQSDPGLPLFEPMSEPSSATQDKLAIDIGNIPAQVKISFQGKWTREADRMIAQDSQASVTFHCEGKRFGIIAQCLAERGEAEVVVELPREFPRDAEVFDEDLQVDFQVLSNPLADSSQKRRGTLKVGQATLYHLFKALPESHREITLRFPSAEKMPVAIYGLRMGD